MTSRRMFAMLGAVVLLQVGPLSAQTPAKDPSDLLREVLPADVAERVLEKIALARSRELPAGALENRALKFAAKGVKPADIEKSLDEQLSRMEEARVALESPRGRKPTGEEIEAGAESLRKGLDGAQVSELAKSAPSGRSLTVPLYVIGGLMDRGLPSDEALHRVLERLEARAADAELAALAAELPAQAADGQAHQPGMTGQDLAATKRSGAAGVRGAECRPRCRPTPEPTRGQRRPGRAVAARATPDRIDRSSR